MYSSSTLHRSILRTQLRDVWNAEISKSGDTARINVIKDLSKMTLDVIGLAGMPSTEPHR